MLRLGLIFNRPKFYNHPRGVAVIPLPPLRSSQGGRKGGNRYLGTQSFDDRSKYSNSPVRLRRLWRISPPTYSVQDYLYPREGYDTFQAVMSVHSFLMRFIICLTLCASKLATTAWRPRERLESLGRQATRGYWAGSEGDSVREVELGAPWRNCR